MDSNDDAERDSLLARFGMKPTTPPQEVTLAERDALLARYGIRPRMLDKEVEREVLVTALLHFGLFWYILVLMFLTSVSMVSLDCGSDLCDQGQVTLVLWAVFGISILVSVVLLVQRRRAFYVPLAAGLVTTACVVAALLVARG